MATNDGCFFEPSIPETELRATWTGIIYMRLILRINWLVIEDDFSTVIG